MTATRPHAAPRSPRSFRFARLAAVLAPLAVAGLVAVPAASAQTGTLFGLGADTGALYTVDPVTAQVSLLANLSGTYTDPGYSGLEVLNGTFYASAVAGESVDYELVSIDPVTGGTALVADLPGDNFLAAAGNEALGLLYLADNDTSSLFTYDVAADTLTSVGSYGTNLRFDGLAYDDAGGVLYGYENMGSGLYTLDPATGQATLVGPIGFTPNEEDFYGLAFDPLAGVLYLSDNADLYTLDPATGAATLVGTNTDGVQLTGLTFAAVPEPSSLGLLGLGGLGLLRRRA